jgi:outer membrane protein TolC
MHKFRSYGSIVFGLWLLALPCLAQDTLKLTATEAVAIALEKNLGIRLAKLEARTSEILNHPGEAGMLPIVGITGLYDTNNSATRQQFFNGDIRETDNANIRALDADLTAEWTIFDGLTMFATRERLAALELIGRTQLRQQIETTIFEVLSSYYQVVQLQKAIEVRQEGLRTSKERLAIAEAAQRIGTASGLVVVQAKLDLSADSAAVLEMTAQAANAASRLGVLLAVTPSRPIGVTDSIPPSEQLDLASIQQEARNSNSTLLQVQQLQLTSDIAVRELRGALFPRLSIYGNYGYTRSTSDVGILQSNRSLGPNYGARLSVPLFSGGRASRAMQIARIQQEQAALSTEEALLMLDQQIIEGWTDHELARQRVALEEENLVGIGRQVAVALESYRIGLLTPVELREVQQGHIDAEDRLLLARYEAKMAELRLKMLAGKLQ